MQTHDNAPDASPTTPTTPDVVWLKGRRDGGYADEIDSWRASVTTSPPVWMRERRPMSQTLRRAPHWSVTS